MEAISMVGNTGFHLTTNTEVRHGNEPRLAPTPPHSTSAQDIISCRPSQASCKGHRGRRRPRENDAVVPTMRKCRHWVNSHCSHPSRVVLPTRFLLGGSIEDPLNLNSLLAADSDNTGYDSLPSEQKESESIVELVRDVSRNDRISFPLIANAADPLELNSCHEDVKQPLISTERVRPVRKRKRIRRRTSATKFRKLQPQMEKSDTVLTNFNGAVAKEGITAEKKIDYDMASNSYISKPVLLTPVKTNVDTADGCDKDGESPLPMSSSSKKSSCGAVHHFHNMDNRIVSPAISQFPSNRKRSRWHRQKPEETNEEVVAAFTKSSDGRSTATVDSSTSKHLDQERFSRGNYLRYYGYRNAAGDDDPRLALFNCSMFEGKDVLDVGCNAGAMTLAVARDFSPRRIVGIDVDERLIGAAKRNLMHLIATGNRAFPSSLKTLYGPVKTAHCQRLDTSGFPHNILFQVVDYVLDSDEDLSKQREEYDVVMALSVSKWIHLNHGDDGLRRAFCRSFHQLRPGGRFILEAQPWSSYRRKKKLTDKIFAVYQNIKFRPEQFNDYLLSPEVGFESCFLLGTPSHKSKGFQRPIYVFTKSLATTPKPPCTQPLNKKIEVPTNCTEPLDKEVEVPANLTPPCTEPTSIETTVLASQTPACSSTAATETAAFFL